MENTPKRLPWHTNQYVHVRDAINYQRISVIILLCLLPAVCVGMWNIGYQANLVLANEPQLIAMQSGWRFHLAQQLTHFEPNSMIANLIIGAIWFLPIFLTAYAVGECCEQVFSKLRHIPRHSGIVTMALLFSLCLPASIPLWQVGLGMAFGVIVAKEIFGGTGFQFMNPVLAGLAFLFFAYPSHLSGDTVWVVVDQYAGATALGLVSQEGMYALFDHYISWNRAFLGNISGSIGETSTLAILLGGLILIWTRIAQWRIVLMMLIGMICMSSLFNLIGSETNPMFAMPWYWHIVVGGFAFACFFLVIDPSSSAMTQTGQLIYGFLLGSTGILFRVLNPAFPESIMLAVLLGNLYAPLIDHFVTQANIKRRMARHE